MYDGVLSVPFQLSLRAHKVTVTFPIYSFISVCLSLNILYTPILSHFFRFWNPEINNISKLAMQLFVENATLKWARFTLLMFCTICKTAAWTGILMPGEPGTGPRPSPGSPYNAYADDDAFFNGGNSRSGSGLGTLAILGIVIGSILFCACVCAFVCVCADSDNEFGSGRQVLVTMLIIVLYLSEISGMVSIGSLLGLSWEDEAQNTAGFTETQKGIGYLAFIGTILVWCGTGYIYCEGGDDSDYINEADGPGCCGRVRAVSSFGHGSSANYLRGFKWICTYLPFLILGALAVGSTPFATSVLVSAIIGNLFCCYACWCGGAGDSDYGFDETDDETDENNRTVAVAIEI